MSEAEYTIESARRAAAEDRLAEWVRDFLASPGSDNAALGDALTDPPRAWLGPVEIPLDQLHRLAGPRGHPVVQAVAEEDWRDDVDELAEAIDDGDEAAPVIASYVDGDLMLEDGNHRVEALRRAGEPRAWVVIAFDDEATRDRFVARAEASAT